MRTEITPAANVVKVTIGPNGHRHVESWRPNDPDAGKLGTGYVLSFEACDWVGAALYVQALRSGKESDMRQFRDEQTR